MSKKPTMPFFRKNNSPMTIHPIAHTYTFRHLPLVPSSDASERLSGNCAVQHTFRRLSPASSRDESGRLSRVVRRNVLSGVCH